jgi:hypothetical protein
MKQERFEDILPTNDQKSVGSYFLPWFFSIMASNGLTKPREAGEARWTYKVVELRDL